MISEKQFDVLQFNVRWKQKYEVFRKRIPK